MALVESVTALSGIKTALDILKALKGRGATAADLAELQSALIDTQQSTIAVQQAHSAQIGRVRELEEEMARLKAWDAEKKQYELRSVAEGAFAYMLKRDARDTEPPHWLCPNCYTKGEKAFFQMSASRFIYSCSRCHGNMRALAQPKWL